MVPWNEELYQKISTWVDNHRDEMIRDLIHLVNIPSVSEAGTEPGPFGQGCRDVVDAFLSLGQSYGFDTHNYEYYVGEIRMGDAPEDIGIWTHLDVVPVGDGWIFEPFQAFERDNYLIGRGSQDNKGPVIGMLYVMRCLKELNVPLRHSIRLFGGTNEEKGMADMDYYTAHYRCPDFNLVPDSGFPVCYGERGAFDFSVTSQIPVSEHFPDVFAGEVRTMIPATACGVFEDTPQIRKFLSELAPCYSVDGTKVTAIGISKHAMGPEGAINPLGLLAQLLLKSPELTSNDRQIVQFLADACEDFKGTAVGLACEDDESGPLIGAATMLRLEPDRRLTFEMSCKFPVTMDVEEIHRRAETACQERGFSLSVIRGHNPSYYDRNHPVVGTLTEIYNKISGNQTQPFIMSGGTYARKLPNAVAYGTGMPVRPLPRELFPLGHGDFHQPDESLDLERQMSSIKIYAASLAAIDQLDL